MKNSSGILTDTIKEVQRQLGEDLQSLTVEKVNIGIFFTGVKLSNGQGGICFTPIKSIPEAVCCPSSARVMPSSGKLRGRSVNYFLDEMFSSSPMKRALAIAVLNALSSTCWKINPPQNYEIKLGADPLDDVVFPKEARVVVIGALVPYFKMLKKQGLTFSILELDPRTLKEDEMEFYMPPEKADSVIQEADYLIITGTTLINDTLEAILDKAPDHAQIVVVGPTASMLPDAFFQRGVTALGGIAVTQPDHLLDVLAEAGSGYHFYGKSAEKIVISSKPTA